MGVLWRKRSLLLKLTVIVGTAWFTIAFLLYTDNRTEERLAALPLDGNSLRVRDVTETKPPPIRRRHPQRIEDDDAGVLLPPVVNAGEMGKPVVLPSNLTGEC